ncbi:hypothetical protein [Hyalangium sp.]|uniref:hypothetical protein n=1 Tax=Hyalangium sp. TaxID=2028555 RepID=UPI002D6C204F|nr:hypothetical protein [Hyalangium sp.]HYH99205.1 hypothetical protein [Hyalangium sp.]
MKKALVCGIVSALLFGGGGEARAEEPLYSERNGIGLKPKPTTAGPVSGQGVTVDPRRSLAVTEKAILSKFLLKDVLDKLALQNGNTGLTSAQLFRQLWDTQNPSGKGQADLTAVTSYPRCSDNANKLNGFPYACREAEGAQASPTSAITMDSYQAVGLFNRFDLMDVEGAVECGEYRIVFAKKDPTAGRNFIIFEGALSLPPAGWPLGHEGCRPVAKFWADLTNDPDVNSRATKLKNFYFNGLPGFLPVIHVKHYGVDNPMGQVRTNQFIAPTWMLREFKLARNCPTSTTCTLKFVPQTAKNTPAGSLFNPNNTSTLAKSFQAHLVTQVKALAEKDVNRFHYLVLNQFNMGQSDAQTTPSTEDDYVTQFKTVTTSTFRTNIVNELKRIGSTLTPEDIVARAQALSCGGCHRRSGGAPMGGFNFPSPAGFVHSSDKDDPADTTRYQLSSALVDTFLPQRKAVLEHFLNTPALNSQFTSQSVPSTATPGQTFPVKITVKNLGTRLWQKPDATLIPVSSQKWGVPKADVNTKVFLEKETTFTFNVVAPTVPGTYPFQWRMALNGGGFGPSSTLVNIIVK